MDKQEQLVFEKNSFLEKELAKKNRELEIEASLERIRSRAIAMQTSEEINALVGLVFTECIRLGIRTDRIILMTFDEETDDVRWWMANSETSDTPINFLVKSHPYAPALAYLEAWKNRTKKWIYHLKGKNKANWDEYIFTQTELSKLPEVVKTGMRSIESIILNVCFQNYGGLTLSTFEDLDPESFELLAKISKVFDLAYTRFLDLQKAEAQAREVRIEAALEKVRSRSLAMHYSNELEQVAGSLFDRLVELGLSFDGALIFLFDKEKRNIQLWVATVHLSAPAKIELPYDKEMENNVLIKDLWHAIETGEHILNRTYSGEDKNDYYRYTWKNNKTKIPEAIRKIHQEKDWTACLVAEKNSIIGFDSWSGHVTSDKDFQILIRFARVFEQAYIRFLDLQKAEVNAKEAVKQSALDRIRADIASMRTVSDLDRITPLIWKELTILGVPFIRCGVFIMDEMQQLIHSFLSTPEGKAIAAFQLPYHSAGELSNVLVHWHKNEVFKDHWDEARFTNWTKSLVERGAITSEEKYSTAHPPVNLDLHFLPFLQGMLYIGSKVPLTNEEIQLAQTLADAFSTAYARYEDFNKLESAKAQIEKTLNDLKQAQSQLIQSEKMASLGELTAGIAHEIQNPLNFVNNFSDVNQELLQELREEANEGNIDEVKSIVNDVIENEEKINHHGKRADAIVKGMLQHSRTSSGQKEPTDINTLANEYLRLSYHGFRAKDKSFNADLQTDFDKSIGKIDVIPQDIGRVLLNLFNNAFYAINEQKSSNSISYKPTVFVRTQKCDDKIQITVRDNGNGIPQKILDKIFQPFFTTKPTGEGTGLGLSLSYDIIKAHGGEIKVESKEGEGSEFIVQLSLNDNVQFD